MPVEIRQIIIRALVRDKGNESNNNGVGTTRSEENAESILRIIEKQKER
ncbi:MAG: hypothetical protein GKR88_10890 [Flavobacteriaceae bacterium]|nr:MAG: hypothetical protein GKR88_10890 [Flavobacteriaceae bacterium]